MASVDSNIYGYEAQILEAVVNTMFLAAFCDCGSMSRHGSRRRVMKIIMNAHQEVLRCPKLFFGTIYIYIKYNIYIYNVRTKLQSPLL
jgi:hypothetical protein